MYKFVSTLMLLLAAIGLSAQTLQTDTYPTGKQDLKVTVLGHGSLMLQYGATTIQVDPYSKVADYSKLPKADLVLLTHEHADHLDFPAIALIKKPTGTHFILPEICYEQTKYGEVVKNGDKTSFQGISIEAVPAYNIVHKRPDGEAFHPKGRGNGYVLTFDTLKLYIAGDTENIPEMRGLKGIDIAFLPKNLPYTMTDEMFIDAALSFKPKYLYPYHFSELDAVKLKEKLDKAGIQLLVRKMKTE